MDSWPYDQETVSVHPPDELTPFLPSTGENPWCACHSRTKVCAPPTPQGKTCHPFAAVTTSPVDHERTHAPLVPAPFPSGRPIGSGSPRHRRGFSRGDGPPSWRG